MRSFVRRFGRPLLLAVVALVLLYAWDDSRQPAAGTNWVLLAARRVIGMPHSVQRIADGRTLASAWEDFRVPGDPAAFDLSDSLVLWLTTASPQGCPARLDGVSIDLASRTVAAHFSRGFTYACDNRQILDSFLMSIDRRALPQAPFEVDLIDPNAQSPTPPLLVDR